MSSKERREEEALLELLAPAPAPLPWCTGVGGAETVVAGDATTAVAATTAADAEEEGGSLRTVTAAPRAGERSIIIVAVVVIVVVEDDLLGAPPSCPRIRSRTLGRHQILFDWHRTLWPAGTPGSSLSRILDRGVIEGRGRKVAALLQGRNVPMMFR